MRVMGERMRERERGFDVKSETVREMSEMYIVGGLGAKLLL